MFDKILSAMFLPTDGNYITPFFCWLIIIVALRYGQRVQRSVASKKRQVAITSSASAILSSMGILGTFFGIFYGLLNFDIDDKKSFSNLLEGLKIAFGSSVLGLSLALVFRGVGDKIRIKEKEEEVSAKQILEALESLKRAFEEFADKVVKTSVEEIVKALREVIDQFDVKIQKQLGESFRLFSEALDKLLEWQKEYKEELQQMKETLEKSLMAIEGAANSLESIKESIAEIPKSVDRLNEIVNRMGEGMKELHADLASFADMREKAQEALPTIQNYWEKISEFSQQQTNALGEQVGSLQGQVDAFNRQISDFEAKMTDSVEGLSNKIKDVDGAIAREIEEAVNSLGGRLAGINEQFVSIYRNLVETVEKSARDLDEEIRSSRGEQ